MICQEQGSSIEPDDRLDVWGWDDEPAAPAAANLPAAAAAAPPASPEPVVHAMPAPAVAAAPPPTTPPPTDIDDADDLNVPAPVPRSRRRKRDTRELRSGGGVARRLTVRAATHRARGDSPRAAAAHRATHRATHHARDSPHVRLPVRR